MYMCFDPADRKKNGVKEEAGIINCTKTAVELKPLGCKSDKKI